MRAERARISGRFFRKKSGAFSTVETSLVMGTVLLSLTLLLFMGLYLHDKCVLAGAVSETAQAGREWERMEEDYAPEQYFHQRISGKLLYFPEPECTVSQSGDRITVRATARTGRMSVTAIARAPVTWPEREIREHDI